MHILPVDLSEKQRSRLRNGHPVRVKHGTGFNVIVSPQTYNVAQRAFAKGKASTVTLTPEEIGVNKNLTPEQHAEYAGNNAAIGDTTPITGGKLFGKHGTITRALRSVGKSKVFKDIVHTVAPIVKEAGMTALKAGIAKAGGNPNNPMFNKALQAAAPHITDMAGQQFDSAHQQLAGQGLMRKIQRHLSQGLHDSLTGEDSGYMGRAGLGTAMANLHSSTMGNAHGIARSMSNPIKAYYDEVGAPPSRGTGFVHRGGSGQGAGYGLGLGAGMGLGLERRRQSHFIQGMGTQQHNGYLPPALVSQPYSANFQFQHFLPPQYQHMIQDDEYEHLSGSGFGAFRQRGSRGLGLYI